MPPFGSIPLELSTVNNGWTHLLQRPGSNSQSIRDHPPAGWHPQRPVMPRQETPVRALPPGPTASVRRAVRCQRQTGEGWRPARSSYAGHPLEVDEPKASARLYPEDDAFHDWIERARSHWAEQQGIPRPAVAVHLRHGFDPGKSVITEIGQ
jgi:hypothetical protein